MILIKWYYNNMQRDTTNINIIICTTISYMAVWIKYKICPSYRGIYKKVRNGEKVYVDSRGQVDQMRQRN